MAMTELQVRAACAALLLLLYAVLCGAIWWRERRKQMRAGQEAAALAQARDGALPWLVAYASQTGQAEELAQETARLLHAAGEPVHLCALDAVDATLLARTQRALFIASTYGEGDAPDNAALFQQHYLQATGGPMQGHALAHLQFGLLALGDRQYTHYCGFGRALGSWLLAQGAVAWFDAIEMDNADPAALAAWQHQLAHIASLGDVSAWQAPVFEPWTLRARRRLNAGSSGGAVFHIELQPPQPGGAADASPGRPGAAPAWESGDLVQVQAPADPAHPREYSIASIASDGSVHLVVRLAQRDDGQPGVASHWLCQGALLGTAVQLRVRAHRNFRLEFNAGRPLVLIGNGTGIAGLRGHLRARAAAAPAAEKPSNWLVFGEREQAHDFLYQQEILAWQAEGLLQRVDLAFSRDQPERVYVQHLLAAEADELRTWVEQRGAAVYVCGSLHGMAQEVHAVLVDVLGAQRVDAMVRDGRYRRDVY
ncbi:MAG: oxidoreductase [Comamonadaceae bacterium]|nr:MAG: oxidoreductase [Comamonadaceae bacterium]